MQVIQLSRKKEHIDLPVGMLYFELPGKVADVLRGMPIYGSFNIESFKALADSFIKTSNLLEFCIAKKGSTKTVKNQKALGTRNIKILNNSTPFIQFKGRMSFSSSMQLYTKNRSFRMKTHNFLCSSFRKAKKITQKFLLNMYY